MTREEVELFCIDHLVMVDIVAGEESLVFDFMSVTTPGPGGQVTGIEAVMQVAHIILTDFKFEEDAFQRAKQGFHEQFASIVKGLESACEEGLTYSLLGGDTRFLCPNHKQIDAMTLSEVQTAITEQLEPGNIEVSLAGDLSVEAFERLVLQYMGTVPPAAPKKLRVSLRRGRPSRCRRWVDPNSSGCICRTPTSELWAIWLVPLPIGGVSIPEEKRSGPCYRKRQTRRRLGGTIRSSDTSLCSSSKR